MGSVAAHSGSVIRARSTSGRRVLLISALALGGVVLALFFLAVLERIVYSGDVMPGVEVEGVDVSSKSEDQAYARLQAAATDARGAAVAGQARRQGSGGRSVGARGQGRRGGDAPRRAPRRAQWQPGRADVRERAPPDPPRRGAAAGELQRSRARRRPRRMATGSRDRRRRRRPAVQRHAGRRGRAATRNRHRPR